MKFSFRYDMRNVGVVPLSELYAAALKQSEWADSLGCDTIYIGEHHGAEDDYIPSPIVLASAIAARTQRLHVHISALVLPLHNPLRLAEDLAVLDLISNGRLEITAGLGYRPREYRMFGVAQRKRVALFNEAIETLRRAWTGEEFDWHGETVRVSPRPYQIPHPPVFYGGNTEASAKRAARAGVGYRPPVPSLFDIYVAEIEKLGRSLPSPPRDVGAVVYVSEDPEEAWSEVGPYILASYNAYARWASEREGGLTPIGSGVLTLKAFRLQNTRYRIMTPQECVEFACTLSEDQELQMEPLIGGLPPELSWKGLLLFENEVIPQLNDLGLLESPS
jgi:alkanesulfonate monooxygenase SsuD/methylene tetrahydromethanopterin reductase-like flavin-dependent oxidoreductase (luciferase family)